SIADGPTGTLPPGATVGPNNTLTPNFTFTPNAATGSAAAPSDWSVALTATDNKTADPDGSPSSSQVRKFTIHVTNLAPIVTIPGPTVVHPNVPFTGSFTFNDPGSGDGPWTALVDFGDGSPQLFFTSTPQAPPVGAINVVDANMGTNGSTISIPSH